MTAEAYPTSVLPPIATSSSYHLPPHSSSEPTSTTTEPIDAPTTNYGTKYIDHTPMSHTATPSSSYFSQSTVSPPLSSLEDVPKFGTIRCYWAILSPSLDYMFQDPILEHHMAEHSRSLVGYNLLDFVHPDERDQLAEDLLPQSNKMAGVVTAGVFGSVTRLRYSRMVGIWRKMGCSGVPELPDADKYALDDQYLTLDLTTSWIAGNATSPKGKDKADGQGAILAFFHVVGDKDHVKNNDMYDRGDWTNWCGVQVDEHAYFTPSRRAALADVLDRITASNSRPSTGVETDSKAALLASLHGLSSETTDGPPPHVFQILDRNGSPIVSFPRPEDKDGRKRYEVEDYAALAREVVARPRGAANARTSCTKRYRSKHPVMKDSTLTTIESVVIMYGSITFACFQTGGIYLTSARKAALGLTHNNALSASPGSATNDFYLEDVPATAGAAPHTGFLSNKRAPPAIVEPEGSASPALKRIKAEPSPSPFHGSNGHSSSEAPQTNGLSISTSMAGRMYRPTIESEYGANGGISPTVASASAILGLISSNHTDTPAPPTSQPLPSPQQRPGNDYLSYRSSTFPYPRNHEQNPSPAPYYPPYYSPNNTSPYTSQPYQHNNGYFPPTLPSSCEHSPYPPVSNDTSSQDPSPTSYEPASSTSHAHSQPPLVSPNERAVDPSMSVEGGDGTNATKETKKSRLRAEGPVFKPGIKACESCNTVNSPEWRKGPSGNKSLCNACGLRYARSVARQKKLAEQAANGFVKKKKGSKAKAVAAAAAAAATESNGGTLPSSSSAHTNYETPFSRASPLPGQKPYTPYHTSAPPHSASYALVAAQAVTTSGPLTSSAPLYPSSTSGYYPATSAYPVSTYPPTSTPILTHIPIHHTLAATLAPLSAPTAIHSHDYSRPGMMPTSMAETPFSTLDQLHALSQAPTTSMGMYPMHSTAPHSSSGGGWQPHYTAVAEVHPPTSLPTSTSSSSMPSPPHALMSHSTSPHLHQLQLQHRSSSYQPYNFWSNPNSNESSNTSNGKSNDLHHQQQSYEMMEQPHDSRRSSDH